MNCKKCGADNDDGVAVCKYCGESMETVTDTIVQPAVKRRKEACL
jgi:uncharacterized membrane protein YvbJ